MAKKATKAAARPGRAPMSDQHKAALAEGREQGRMVRRYLEALELHRPRRGRKRTAESIQRRLDAIRDRLVTADPLNRLQLSQEQMDLEAELASMGESGVDMAELEEGFVRVAAAYAARKGISYEAWRSAGVSAATLRRAGISRSS